MYSCFEYSANASFLVPYIPNGGVGLYKHVWILDRYTSWILAIILAIGLFGWNDGPTCAYSDIKYLQIVSLSPRHKLVEGHVNAGTLLSGLIFIYSSDFKPPISDGDDTVTSVSGKPFYMFIILC